MAHILKFKINQADIMGFIPPVLIKEKKYLTYIREFALFGNMSPCRQNIVMSKNKTDNIEKFTA